MRIEKIEDQERFQEDTCKEILASLNQIFSEIEIKNVIEFINILQDSLNNKLHKFSKELEKSVLDKNDTKEDV